MVESKVFRRSAIYTSMIVAKVYFASSFYSDPFASVLMCHFDYPLRVECFDLFLKMDSYFFDYFKTRFALTIQVSVRINALKF